MSFALRPLDLMKLIDETVKADEGFAARRFSQADSSDACQTGGTGLGLSISKVIVERLGGEIGFTAGKGKATTFYFFLPECSEPAGARFRSSS